MNNKHDILYQTIKYEGKVYSITDLVHASKDFETIKLRTDLISRYYLSPCDDDFDSFVEHCKRVNNASLDYPIILSPQNTILDGRHRLAKALITGEKYIKAVKFEQMPDVGQTVSDD